MGRLRGPVVVVVVVVVGAVASLPPLMDSFSSADLDCRAKSRGKELSLPLLTYYEYLPARSVSLSLSPLLQGTSTTCRRPLSISVAITSLPYLALPLKPYLP